MCFFFFCILILMIFMGYAHHQNCRVLMALKQWRCTWAFAIEIKGKISFLSRTVDTPRLKSFRILFFTAGSTLPLILLLGSSSNNYRNETASKCEMSHLQPNQVHPGLAKIPAPIGSQEVVATPTNSRCWLVNICLGAGRVLQPVQNGSHLMNVMISIGILTQNYRDPSCTLAFEYVGPVLHPAMVRKDNPSFVTSHPGTQQCRKNSGHLWLA